MNYANIKYYDIANGPGVRTSVFVSGCRHHCPGCFNAVAWDFDYGQPFDKTVRNEVFASCQPDYIAGLSLLGGEPFEPENQPGLLALSRKIRAAYPEKSIWSFSGYLFDRDILAARRNPLPPQQNRARRPRAFPRPRALPCSSKKKNTKSKNIRFPPSATTIYS